MNSLHCYTAALALRWPGILSLFSCRHEVRSVLLVMKGIDEREILAIFLYVMMAFTAFACIVSICCYCYDTCCAFGQDEKKLKKPCCAFGQDEKKLKKLKKRDSPKSSMDSQLEFYQPPKKIFLEKKSREKSQSAKKDDVESGKTSSLRYVLDFGVEEAWIMQSFLRHT